MSVLTINDKALIVQLEAIAEREGISVDTLVQQLLRNYVDSRSPRCDDPIVGLFDSGQDDIVDRHEDILNEWQPD